MRLLLLIIAPFFTRAAEWPQPDFKNCDYYKKIEELLNCTPKGYGYLSNYGYFYCKEFKKESSGWSKKAQTWTQNTGQCLQEMLRDNKDKRITPCKQMEEFAFDVHPVCYKQYGICDLSMSDIYGIISTIRKVDILTRKSLSQMLNVGLACMAKYVSSEENATFNRIDSITTKFNLNERQIAASIFLMAPQTSQPDRKAYFGYALSLLIGTDKQPAPQEAVRIYSNKYGLLISEPTNDSLFFSCGKSVAKWGDASQCNQDFSETFKELPAKKAKMISNEISSSDMNSIIKNLSGWHQLK